MFAINTRISNGTNLTVAAARLLIAIAKAPTQLLGQPTEVLAMLKADGYKLYGDLLHYRAAPPITVDKDKQADALAKLTRAAQIVAKAAQVAHKASLAATKPVLVAGEKCPSCNGTGKREFARQGGDCFTCRATGHITPEIKESVERYWAQRAEQPAPPITLPVAEPELELVTR